MTTIEQKKKYIHDITNSKEVDEYLSKTDCIDIGNMIRRSIVPEDEYVEYEIANCGDKQAVNDGAAKNVINDLKKKENVITFQKDGGRVNLDLINNDVLIDQIYNYITYKVNKHSRVI